MILKIPSNIMGGVANSAHNIWYGVVGVARIILPSIKLCTLIIEDQSVTPSPGSQMSEPYITAGVTKVENSLHLVVWRVVP